MGFSCLVGRARGAPGERRGALGLGDQNAEAQKDVLVAGQPAHAALLEQLGQRVAGERCAVGPDLWPLGVERLELAGRAW